MRSGAKFLSDSEISQLPKLLEHYLPRSTVVYNIIQLYLQNRYNTSHLNTKFYNCTPSLEEDSVFLVCIFEKTYEETEVVVFTSHPCGGSEESLEAFESLINWDLPNTFGSTNGPFTDRITELCLKHGKILEATKCKFNIMNSNKMDENYLQKQEALNDTKGISISPLRIEDAKLVTSKWKFARENTETEIQDLIAKIASCGIYVDSELASWMILNEIGTMGSLYTEEIHRGKGYAEIIARNVTNTARSMGIIPSVEMEPYNDSSFKLFSKIGYEFAFKSEWVGYFPK